MLSRFVTCAVTKPILLPRALAARKVCSRCRYVNKRKLIEEENPLSSFANVANFYQSTNFFLQSVSNNLHRIHQSASVKLTEKRRDVCNGQTRPMQVR